MQSWQIGDVRVTRLQEQEPVWPGTMITGQATAENVLREGEWLKPFTDDKGRFRLSIHSLLVESEGHRVLVGRREIHLTPTEFQLLSYLVHRPGRVISHRELLLAVWGRGYENEHHLLQVAVRNVRTKLDDHNRSRYVTTVYGTGYRLTEL